MEDLSIILGSILYGETYFYFSPCPDFTLFVVRMRFQRNKKPKKKKKKLVIWRLFHVLAEFPLTTSELDLDYDQQRVNVRAGIRALKWLTG